MSQESSNKIIGLDQLIEYDKQRQAHLPTELKSIADNNFVFVLNIPTNNCDVYFGYLGEEWECINWGDGSITNSEAHTYATAGEYICQIIGKVTSPLEIYESNLNEYVTQVILPKYRTEICENEFHSCENLKKIHIHDGITKIGDSAFFSCYSLSSVEIPDSVTSMDGSVFMFCESLNNIKISNSLNVLPEVSFYGCSSLTEVYIPSNVNELGRECFSHCTNLKRIIVDGSVLFNNEFVDQSCSSLQEIILNNTKLMSTIDSEMPAYLNQHFPNLKVIVPYNLLEQYKNSTNWAVLGDNIVSVLDTASGITHSSLLDSLSKKSDIYIKLADEAMRLIDSPYIDGDKSEFWPAGTNTIIPSGATVDVIIPTPNLTFSLSSITIHEGYDYSGAIYYINFSYDSGVYVNGGPENLNNHQIVSASRDSNGDLIYTKVDSINLPDNGTGYYVSGSCYDNCDIREFLVWEGAELIDCRALSNKIDALPIVSGSNINSILPSINPGKTALAWGSYSIAFGEDVTTRDDYSVAIGKELYTWNKNHYVFGKNLTTSTDSDVQFIVGSRNSVDDSQNAIFVVANGSNIEGRNAFLVDYDGSATLQNSLIIGRYNSPNSHTTLNNYNISSGLSPVLQIGIGTSESDRENSMTMYKDGSSFWNKPVYFNEYVETTKSLKIGNDLTTNTLNASGITSLSGGVNINGDISFKGGFATIEAEDGINLLGSNVSISNDATIQGGASITGTLTANGGIKSTSSILDLEHASTIELRLTQDTQKKSIKLDKTSGVTIDGTLTVAEISGVSNSGSISAKTISTNDILASNSITASTLSANTITNTNSTNSTIGSQATPFGKGYFNSITLTNAPVNNYDAVTKKYVDDKVASGSGNVEIIEIEGLESTATAIKIVDKDLLIQATAKSGQLMPTSYLVDGTFQDQSNSVQLNKSEVMQCLTNGGLYFDEVGFVPVGGSYTHTDADYGYEFYFYLYEDGGEYYVWQDGYAPMWYTVRLRTPDLIGGTATISASGDATLLLPNTNGKLATEKYIQDYTDKMSRLVSGLTDEQINALKEFAKSLVFNTNSNI